MRKLPNPGRGRCPQSLRAALTTSGDPASMTAARWAPLATGWSGSTVIWAPAEVRTGDHRWEATSTCGEVGPDDGN